MLAFQSKKEMPFGWIQFECIILLSIQFKEWTIERDRKSTATYVHMNYIKEISPVTLLRHFSSPFTHIFSFCYQSKMSASYSCVSVSIYYSRDCQRDRRRERAREIARECKREGGLWTCDCCFLLAISFRKDSKFNEMLGAPLRLLR